MSELGHKIAIIPARKGSKRLPGKNMLQLAGKPLISWTIEAALASAVLDTIVVTSDDLGVLQLARDYGVVAHERCPNLCTDQATSAQVVKDVLQTDHLAIHHPATAVLLQPTSPLRQASDIINALKLYSLGSGKTVVSIAPLNVPAGVCVVIGPTNPGLVVESLVGKSKLQLPLFRLNGAVYVFDVTRFLATGEIRTPQSVGMEMPPERSIDVDWEGDLNRCAEFINDHAG